MLAGCSLTLYFPGWTGQLLEQLKSVGHDLGTPIKVGLLPQSSRVQEPAPEPLAHAEQNSEDRARWPRGDLWLAQLQ